MEDSQEWCHSHDGIGIMKLIFLDQPKGSFSKRKKKVSSSPQQLICFHTRKFHLCTCSTCFKNIVLKQN
ncbi:hypothetical protein NC652_022485 [Populus alba x Populus x berolinensis]|nr:hypothetical protein NC652_022485 [Populus alba x Populus x berolinensis]